MKTLLTVIAPLAAILILLVILTLSPLVLRVLGALARKWFLLITHRWQVRAEHRRPEPGPLPDTVVPEALAGLGPCEVERRFGRRSTETRIDDVVEMAWNDVDPRLVCFFRDGACVLATLDPYWHRRARSEDELRRIFDWSQTHCHRLLTICWGAMAAPAWGPWGWRIWRTRPAFGWSNSAASAPI